MLIKLLSFCFVANLAAGKLQHVDFKTLLKDDSFVHPKLSKETLKFVKTIPGEETNAYWNDQAQATLAMKLALTPNTNKAKNVIFFIGDGMSLATVAAARTHVGQQDGRPGEETRLSFEEFPYSGLSKTYCVDAQVADSACSATAYLTGVKTNDGTIGVNAQVIRGDCESSINISTHTSSIAKWSQAKNKRTGFVTTTRVTHASPAGVYVNTADRDWESDHDMNKDHVVGDCTDIAWQLINTNGKDLNVIMGGGRAKMIPKHEKDEEGDEGEREDGVNLINEWKKLKSAEKAKYVWNRTELLQVPAETDYLLGLFESDHCKYHLDATDAEPTLAEMTEAAIKVLDKSDEGYFLFVEGGRIDTAHHDVKTRKALDETQQFSEAIKRARQLTNIEDTLIVVSSDHAHTMTYNGYPVRGHDVFEFAGDGSDGLAYATLSYANGAGYHQEIDGVRYDLSKDDLTDKNYHFPSMVPISSETHGGEDVGIYASGPWAHLFTGVMEQNVIPHLMAYASCVGEGATMCD